jgi:DNA-binding transcriptional ArsR family regulator
VADESGRRRRKRDKSAGKRRRPSREEPSEPRREVDLLAGLRHRSRRKVLRRLHRADGPMSPAELARELSISVMQLSYHVNVLGGYRMVELVAEKPARGTMEHFYESKVAADPFVLEILSRTEDEDEGGDEA